MGASSAPHQVEGKNVNSEFWARELDNDEWGHWEPSFGLIAVDRGALVRTPKPTLAWLGARAREARPA